MVTFLFLDNYQVIFFFPGHFFTWDTIKRFVLSLTMVLPNTHIGNTG